MGYEIGKLAGSVRRASRGGWVFTHGNSLAPYKSSAYVYKFFGEAKYGSDAAAKAAALAYQKDPKLQAKLVETSRPYVAAQKYGIPYKEWIKKSERERAKYAQEQENIQKAKIKKAKNVAERTFTYKNKSYAIPTQLPMTSINNYKEFIRHLTDNIINRKPGVSIVGGFENIPAYKNEKAVAGKKVKWEQGQGRIWRDLSLYFEKGKTGTYKNKSNFDFFEDINIKKLIPAKDHLAFKTFSKDRVASLARKGVAVIAAKVKSGELVLGDPLVKPVAQFISKNPGATKEEFISAIRKSVDKNLTDTQIRDSAVRAHANIIRRAMAKGLGEKIGVGQFVALKDIDSAALRGAATSLFKMYPDQIHRTFQRTLEEHYKDKPRLLKKSLNKLRDFEKIKKSIVKEFNIKSGSFRDAPFQFDHPISIKALERSGDFAGAIRTNPVVGDVNQFKKYLDQKLNTYQRHIIKGTNVDVNLGNIERLQNINKTLLGKLAGDFTMDKKGVIKVIDYGAKDFLDPKYDLAQSLKENLSLGRKIKETTALRDPALVEDVGALFGKEGSSKFFKRAKKLTTLDESKIANFINLFNKGLTTPQKNKAAIALGCLGAAEGGRIGYALGTATINCVNTKLTNEPVQSSMRLRVTEGIGKMKPAAATFLSTLGKFGAKAAPLAALAAVGAGIEPLVKQFVADDPTTYLTNENQMKGMLLATIEGEKPKVDEEILKWQLPALGAATAAGAIPGAGETYKARRGLPPTKSFVGPMEKGVGPVRSALGIKGVLGKALGATFSPLAVAATLPMDIAAQRKGGTEWGDIATDPLHWMGPAFASTGAEMASKGIKNPILLKALRMGMSPRTLSMVSRRFGLPGLAISAGMWGYDKWKNRSINDDE